MIRLTNSSKNSEYDIQGVLPKEYKPHKLKGDFKGTIECHIAADWLLIYEKAEEIKLIRLVRTGTHSDLFNK